MDISNLAKKPKLTRLDITDEDIVATYGDTISFWIIDEMDVATYFDFYKLQQSQDATALNALIRKLILKEDGKPALAEDEIFPVDLTLAVLVKINDFLGKSKTKSAESETGNTQS